MHAALSHLLQAPPDAVAVRDADTWASRWRALSAQGHDAVGLAVLGGFAADRLAWAFASGYQAALRALPVARPAAGTIFGLSVTEAAGNRPRDIASRLFRAGDGTLRLVGHKRWATLATVSDALLVIARDETGPIGDPDARAELTAVWVPRGTAGVVMHTMPPTDFVSEVPHAEIDFADVRLADADRVPGDAYAAIVKPFRSIEDLFVALAALAWLVREARAHGWPRSLSERMYAVIVSLAALSRRDAADAATHVGLAGAMSLAAALHAEVDALWTGDEPAARRWHADRALFAVAGEARRLRLERAWQKLDAK